jgi:hypothetical protein
MHLLVCAFMHARDFEHTHTYAWQQGIELLNCLQTAHGSTTQKYSYVDASSVTDVDLFSCACSVQIKARYHWWNHLPLPDVIGDVVREVQLSPKKFPMHEDLFARCVSARILGQKTRSKKLLCLQILRM